MKHNFTLDSNLSLHPVEGFDYFTQNSVGTKFFSVRCVGWAPAEDETLFVAFEKADRSNKIDPIQMGKIIEEFVYFSVMPTEVMADEGEWRACIYLRANWDKETGKADRQKVGTLFTFTVTHTVFDDSGAAITHYDLANLARYQREMEQGYYAARGFHAWRQEFVYRKSEIVYFEEKGEFGALVRSLKDGNTEPPYADGKLNAEAWEEIVDFNVISEEYFGTLQRFLQEGKDDIDGRIERAQGNFDDTLQRATEQADAAEKSAQSSHAGAASAWKAADAMNDIKERIVVYVNELPETGDDSHIYAIVNSEDNTLFDLYVYMAGDWHYLGSTYLMATFEVTYFRTLTLDGWTERTQEVAVADLAENCNVAAVPVDEDAAEYVTCGVKAAQEIGKLVFTCEKTPSKDIGMILFIKVMSNADLPGFDKYAPKEEVAALMKAEQKSRADADAALREALETEARGREEDVGALRGEISAEATARSEEDETLSGRIDAEAESRSRGDVETLNTAKEQIAAERSRATEAEQDLAAQASAAEGEIEKLHAKDEEQAQTLAGLAAADAGHENKLSEQAAELTARKKKDEEQDSRLGDVEKAAADAKSLAMGRSRAKVFDTYEEMSAWLAVSENAASLQAGDNLFIRAQNVPDYWWDGTSALALESPKVDLTEYEKTADAERKIDSAQEEIRGELAVVDAKAQNAQKAADSAQKTADGKYAKPTGGVPKSDLDSAVKASLEKADAAMPKSGGTFTGPVTFNDASLPEDKNANYFVVVDNYKPGYASPETVKEKLGVNAAQKAAEQAQNAAEAAMQKDGGEFTGPVTFPSLADIKAASAAPENNAPEYVCVFNGNDPKNGLARCSVASLVGGLPTSGIPRLTLTVEDMTPFEWEKNPGEVQYRFFSESVAKKVIAFFAQNVSPVYIEIPYDEEVSIGGVFQLAKGPGQSVAYCDIYFEQTTWRVMVGTDEESQEGAISFIDLDYANRMTKIENDVADINKVATQNARGLMSASDKKKLDAFGEASEYATKNDVKPVADLQKEVEALKESQDKALYMHSLVFEISDLGILGQLLDKKGAPTLARAVVYNNDPTPFSYDDLHISPIMGQEFSNIELKVTWDGRVFYGTTDTITPNGWQAYTPSGEYLHDTCSGTIHDTVTKIN